MNNILSYVIILIAIGSCSYSAIRLNSKIKNKKAKFLDYSIHFILMIFWIGYYWDYISSIF